MKKILFLIIITLVIFPIFSGEILFRDFAFGSLMEDVIVKEGDPNNIWTKDEGKSLGNNVIRYNSKTVAGYSAQVEFEFDFFSGDFNISGLVSGIYNFTFEQKVLAYTAYDPTEYVNCYIDLKNKLSVLYGEPTKTENELVEIKTGISALMSNTLSESTPYGTIWDNENGRVFLMLDFNESWSLSLLYLSPKLRDYFVDNQKIKEEDTSGL